MHAPPTPYTRTAHPLPYAWSLDARSRRFDVDATGLISLDNLKAVLVHGLPSMWFASGKKSGFRGMAQRATLATVGLAAAKKTATQRTDAVTSDTADGQRQRTTSKLRKAGNAMRLVK